MRALTLLFVQLLLALSWTVYVAFLPQLAMQANIPKQYTAWILLLDQILFVAMDYVAGIAADRVAGAMRRLSGWIMGVTVVSCTTFLLLPQTSSASVLIGLTAIWAVTSSALRAPPMVIIARTLSISAPTFLVTCSVLGMRNRGTDHDFSS